MSSPDIVKIAMEKRKTSSRRGRKKRAPSHHTVSDPGSDGIMIAGEDGAQGNSMFSSETIIYCILLLLKVGLWIVCAFLLSQIHLGACLLVPLTYRLLSGGMQNVMNWIMTRLQAPDQ